MLVATLVDRVRDEWLEGSYAANYNQLAAAVGGNSTDTELVMAFKVNGPAPGALLTIDDELCQVIEVIAEQRKVQVIRGVRGTNRAPHGKGAIVEANPRYWRRLIRQAAYSELESWPKELYRTEAYRTTIAAGALAIQVQHPSQCPVRRVLAVRRTAASLIDPRNFGVTYSDALDVTIDGDCWVFLDCPTPANARATVHLATDWNLRSEWDDTTDLAAVGLTDSQIDALVLGTTWRIVTGKEIRRLQTESQGQSRTPQDVPPGSWSNMGVRLFTLRNQRIEDEKMKLAWREGHL